MRDKIEEWAILMDHHKTRVIPPTLARSQAKEIMFCMIEETQKVTPSLLSCLMH